MEGYLRRILPKLTDEEVETVLKTLDHLGVEEQSDLEYVEENDLKTVLKPVQARKLIRNRNSEPTMKPAEASCSYRNPSISVSSENDVIHNEPPTMVCAYSLQHKHELQLAPAHDPFPSTPDCTPPPQDWAYQFEVPWHKFPPPLMTACRQNLRPDPSHRKEMVRVIVDEVLTITRKPKRKNLDRIAHKIVSQYPDSFRDGFDGVVLGEGHSSLTNQLMNRFENTNRKARRLGYPPKDSEKNEWLKRKISRSDSWSGESEDGPELMHWQKLCLIEEYEKYVQDHGMIRQLMKDTFRLQRHEITELTTVRTIQTDWPFLLEKVYLRAHYNALVGKAEDDNEFKESFHNRALSVYKCLKTSSKCGMQEVISVIKDECRACGNDHPKSIRIPDLLTCSFREDRNLIYRSFEEDTAIEEILPALPSSPIVVVLGKSPSTARTHFVCMKNVAITKFESFLDALAFVFWSYHVFKFVFPERTVVTFEFIQRYFAGINSLGEKGPRKKSRYQVHPKVLSLMKRIMISQQGTAGNVTVDHGPT